MTADEQVGHVVRRCRGAQRRDPNAEPVQRLGEHLGSKRVPIPLGARNDGVSVTVEWPGLADQRVQGGGRDSGCNVFVGDGELVHRLEPVDADVHVASRYRNDARKNCRNPNSVWLSFGLAIWAKMDRS